MTNSVAAGGQIAAIAAAELAPVILKIDGVEDDLSKAKADAAPLVATVAAARRKASNRVHYVYDVTRNELGRPAVDQHLSMIFPGGASHYINGEAGKLPDRIECLAELFLKNIHPKLSAAHNQEAADKLCAAAKVHREAIAAARIPIARVVLLERTQIAMGRSAHSALANFKRLLKVAGYTEAQIHEIIPSHARSPAKKPPAKEPAKEEPAKEGQSPT